MKGSSETTGPQCRSSANWIGIAAKHLEIVSIENGWLFQCFEQLSYLIGDFNLQV